MSKLNWNIVHECDDEDGNPTQWSSEINHPKYGKYCWINDMGDYFGVEVDYGGFTELVECKSLRIGDKHQFQAVGSMMRVTDSERTYSQCI